MLAIKTANLAGLLYSNIHWLTYFLALLAVGLSLLSVSAISVFPAVSKLVGIKSTSVGILKQNAPMFLGY